MARKELLGGQMGEVVARLIVLVAAGNRALIEFADQDVLRDYLGLGPDEITLAMAVVAVAVGISAYNLAVWQGWIEG